ncbi:glycosyltransferase [Carnobacteriaceae bacterium zg-ZUI252]|nr:glycosyltransferase [Carnobacteriaceae bacterium zg-ZUI252]QTU83025.1 glycosyltransferase [Carnobacteriaceae bacterium zg-C25]
MITIVIPVFNSEKYLEQTLESIVKQTIFSDISVVLVNDGSTDNSLAICQTYADRFSNITVYTIENSGVSVARSYGLSKVKTAYVGFCDADDIIEATMYEKLLHDLQTYDVDIATTDMLYIDLDGKAIKKRPEQIIHLKNQKDCMVSFFTSGMMDNSLCNKLFKTEKCRDIHITNNLRIGEDMYFLFKVLQNSHSMLLNTTYTGYHYIFRQTSAMKSGFSDRFYDAVVVAQKMVDEVALEHQPLAQAKLVHEQCKLVHLMYTHQQTHQKEYRTLLQAIKRYPILKNKQLFDKNIFLSIMLMKIHPLLYAMVKKRKGSS